MNEKIVCSKTLAGQTFTKIVNMGRRRGCVGGGGAHSSVIRAINRENIPPRDKMGKCPYDVIVDYGFSPDFMKTS